jgi:hypothetical protein
MSLSVTITKDDLKGFLQEVPAALRGADLKRAMGQGAANEVRDNFAELQKTRPNKMGWPRQGYWAQAARSVTRPKPTGEGVSFSITQPGIGARYFGPTEIKPVAAKTLAVPATAEAYGTRPIDARWRGKLEFKMVGGRHMALVAKENFMRVVSKGARKGQQVKAAAEKATTGLFEVIFWLRRKVTIKQDKSVLPTADQLRAAAIAGGREYLQAPLAKGGKA